MPAYRFEAASAAGRIERGIVDADSPRQARGVLRDRGLTPISVATVEDRAAGGAGSMVIGGRLPCLQSHRFFGAHRHLRAAAG